MGTEEPSLPIYLKHPVKRCECTSRHLILAIIWFLASAGCSSWQGKTFDPGVAPTISGADPVRATRYDGTVVVLHRVHLTADSLFGDFGNPPRRLAISLSDIRRLEERRISPPHTVGLVLVVAAMGVLGFFVWFLFHMPET